MSPTAPEPTYSDGGSLLGNWDVRIWYDCSKDVVVVTWFSASTPTRKMIRGTLQVDGDDVEAALKEVHRRTVALSVRRLF